MIVCPRLVLEGLHAVLLVLNPFLKMALEEHKGYVNDKNVSEEDDKDTEIFLGATNGGLTKRHKTTFFQTNTMKIKTQEKCGSLLTPLED